MDARRISIQQAPFDVGAVIDRLRKSDPGVGAVATFVGACRDMNDGAGVSDMTLEQYPGMTERAIARIVVGVRQFDVQREHVTRIEPGVNPVQS